MKFTKQDFSEELKKKLTDGGKKSMSQSERTFNASVERIYKRLEKADDSSELDAAVAEYLPDFEEIEGNLRKDFSDFVKAKEKNGKTEQPPAAPDKPATDDDKFAQLMKKLEAMEQKQQEREEAEKVAGIKKSLKSALKKEGVEDAEWIDKYIKKLNVTADTDVDEEKKDALELYNYQKADTPDFVSPKKTGGKGASDFELSDLKKKKK